MKPTPLWQLPKDFNSNETEGREAFRAGYPMEHRYGECLAAQDWERGWKNEERKASS